MATCDICGNEFRNNSGLSGHKQLAHRSESAYSSALERSPERSTKRSEQLQERLVQEFEERLLEQIQPQLDRIEQAALLIEQVRSSAIEAHKHGMSDPHCPGCNEVVRRSLNAAKQEGIDETTKYFEGIPGVKQLVETYERIKANGGVDPALITITPG